MAVDAAAQASDAETDFGSRCSAAPVQRADIFWSKLVPLVVPDWGLDGGSPREEEKRDWRLLINPDFAAGCAAIPVSVPVPVPGQVRTV